ncbi:MAG: glycine--tRNA ligase subunit beta [Candidatus Pelagibacter sp.]
MSEFFLELFTEEVPSNLQVKARKFLLTNFENLFHDKKVPFKKSFSYSVPNRLVICFEGLKKKIVEKKYEKKGPSTLAPKEALAGFLKSNNIHEKDIFKKKVDKGEFYFFIKPEKKIETFNILKEFIPKILDSIEWKKSMRWGDSSLSWARPLKSILAILDGKLIDFKYHHLSSTNQTFLDKEFEEKTKKITNLKNYKNNLKNLNLIIDQSLRKDFIKQEIQKISNRNSLKVDINPLLLEEVTNLVEQPNIILCKFDKKFLKIPREILIITMQNHQKYFHALDNKGDITNQFFVVANNKDLKGFIKSGNERVIEARLSDAEFFWNKNKNQNLLKQMSKLKNMNYFKGLGTYFDKTQRMRKLGGFISDQLLISKDKIEISCSICKVDLVSDLVGEFPELQGIMGGYFAETQGFDKEVSLAVKEHYLPNSLESKIPKKSYSLALSLTDKLDTLVGFFSINLKPTGSKDPFALRRAAIGIIRLIIENNINLKLKDLINYSLLLYQENDFKFENSIVQKDLETFLIDRLKYYMKEKNIRSDIINAGLNSFGINNLNKIYKKSLALDKIILKESGQDIISSYKRASNILENEVAKNNIELSEIADPGIFKNEIEKKLFKKIKELKKYFTNLNNDEKYEITLDNLRSTKPIISDFFDNIIVNDEDNNIKKNRLELLQMFCRTFDNYINFSKIESV